MVWVQLLWFLVTTVISIALAPKPKSPRAAAIEDFSFPTAEEGRPIPVVFGTVDISGPNVVWYGDLSSKKIKQSSGFSSVTVGYRYFLGFHLGLCHGPVDAVTRIEWGEKEAWTGNITASGSGSINQEDLFGGRKREGGILGDFDLAFGDDGQDANAYLVSKIGADVVPAYRGILSFIWKGGYVGTTSYVKPIKIRVKRTAAGWQGTTWYPEKVEIAGGLMNPAHIVYQCLTDTEWGMGVPTSFINDAAFRAAADTFYDEGFGLGLLWNQQAQLIDFLKIITDHCGASLALRLDTGQYELVPVRGDYDPEDLPLLDPSNVVEVSDYQRQGWGETVNEVTLVYTDPDTGKDTTVTAHDMGNIDAQQQRIPATVEYRGIKNHDIAKQVVARELQARVTPLAKLKLVVNRTAWNLPHNEVFRLTWPAREVEEVVFRILAINRGNVQDNTIVIDAVEDVYALELAEYLTTNPNDADPTPPPTPSDDPDPGIGVISTSTTTPPSNPYPGDRYFVNGDGTGAWGGGFVGFADWDEDDGEWILTPTQDGQIVYDADDGLTYQVQGGELVPFPQPVPLDPDPSGTYTNASITVDQYGRVIAADSGEGEGGGGGSGGIAYADGSVPTGNAIGNTSAETAFASSHTFSVLNMQAGVVVRWLAHGVYSTDAAVAPTLRLRVKLGSTTILDSAAFNTTANISNGGWKLEGAAIITAAGASGELEAQGLASLATGVASASIVHMTNTAKVSVNMAAPRALMVTAEWGTADADNTITMRELVVFREAVAEVIAEQPVALLHFEASDGAVIFIDECRKQWVPIGDAQIDTTQFKFGAASLYFDGTGDYVRSMSDADFVFGTGDFTIECWVRFQSRSGNNFVFAFGGGWAVYTFSNQWAVFDGSASNVIIGGSVSDDIWYHVALVREGTNLKLFVAGAQIGSTVVNTTDHTASIISLGAGISGGAHMNGWVDEVRVHRSAQYVGPFTPPSAAFPNPTAVPEVEVALLHLEGADGSTTFTDVMGKTWTGRGSAAIDTAQFKFGAAALEDTSHTDAIETTAHEDFAYEDGDFTLEFWLRPSNVTGLRIIYDQRTALNQARPCLYTNGGDLHYYVLGADRITGGTISVGTWHHIAICRYNGTTRLFLDGVVIGSPWTDSTVYEESPVLVGDAGDTPGQGIQGHFDEIRITKGHARYTQAFTVPNAAFPDP